MYSTAAPHTRLPALTSCLETHVTTMRDMFLHHPPFALLHLFIMASPSWLQVLAHPARMSKCAEEPDILARVSSPFGRLVLWRAKGATSAAWKRERPGGSVDGTQRSFQSSDDPGVFHPIPASWVVRVCWSRSQAVKGGEAGATLDRSPTQTQTSIHTCGPFRLFISPNKQVFLECWG